MKSVGILALTLLLAACASATDNGTESSADLSASTRVQMNDVSIVLPLAKTAKELDAGYLHASSLGRGGAMLPKDLYVKTTGNPADPSSSGAIGSDRTMAYSSLRAVAFRIDPCFAQIGPVTDASKCLNQLRVIWQAVSLENGASSVLDGAVHAFYALTREELTALLAEVVQARVANGGTADLGPLAPHPIVVEQGLLGAESTRLQSILGTYAGTKNLTRFTIFQSTNLQVTWNFSGFDIASGKATPMVIPKLPGKATTESFFAGFFTTSLSGDFTPATTADDNLQLLANAATAKAATKAKQLAAVDAAFRIENPDVHSPDTMDCASCHLAGPSLRMTAGHDLGLDVTSNANAFTPNLAWTPAADLEQTTIPAPDATLNVHVFSYRGAELMIARRVINETANVVAYVNTAIQH